MQNISRLLCRKLPVFLYMSYERFATDILIFKTISVFLPTHVFKVGTDHFEILYTISVYNLRGKIGELFSNLLIIFILQ